jgi:hypothetical protein|nr:hypothetical protein [Kofleriaceae bacterium]
MRRIAWIGVALCAGCGGSAPPPEHAHGDVVEVPVPRDTAPPALAIGSDGHVAATGLPAIARASEVVVVAVQDGSGLRVDVRDRDDKTLRSFAATPAQPSLDAANKQLAMLHGVHDLRAMTPLAVEAGHDHEDQHWATGDNLDVEWRDHRLSVFRHNANAALVEADGAPWLPPERGACRNPAFLRAAYHGAMTSSLVIDIGYRDGDGGDCRAPADQLHVVTWYDH